MIQGKDELTTLFCNICVCIWQMPFAFPACERACCALGKQRIQDGAGVAQAIKILSMSGGRATEPGCLKRCLRCPANCGQAQNCRIVRGARKVP